MNFIVTLAAIVILIKAAWWLFKAIFVGSVVYKPLIEVAKESRLWNGMKEVVYYLGALAILVFVVAGIANAGSY